MKQSTCHSTLDPSLREVGEGLKELSWTGTSNLVAERKLNVNITGLFPRSLLVKEVWLFPVDIA